MEQAPCTRCLATSQYTRAITWSFPAGSSTAGPLKKGSEQRWLVIESAQPIVTPKRYRNHFGQLLEHSPYCERDFRSPTLQPPWIEAGAFPIDIRKEGMIHTVTYAAPPL